MKNMDIKIHKKSDELLLELEGVWDMPSSEELIMTCLSYKEAKTNVTIDLSKVEYIYISGLRHLLYIQYLAAKENVRLRLVNVDERTYKKLLDLNYIEGMEIIAR